MEIKEFDKIEFVSLKPDEYKNLVNRKSSIVEFKILIYKYNYPFSSQPTIIKDWIYISDETKIKNEVDKLFSENNDRLESNQIHLNILIEEYERKQKIIEKYYNLNWIQRIFISLKKFKEKIKND